MNHMRLLGALACLQLAKCSFAEKNPIQLASWGRANLYCANDVYRDLREAQSSPGVLA